VGYLKISPKHGNTSPWDVKGWCGEANVFQGDANGSTTNGKVSLEDGGTSWGYVNASKKEVKCIGFWGLMGGSA
jgi:hypothetical protein